MSNISYNYDEIIKKSLKENLKVKTQITFPAAFSDGKLITLVYFDNELISKSETPITRSSTMFSF